MKTTLELPDPLMRKVKIRAAQTDRTLKDVIAELIERGMQEPLPKAQPGRMDLTDYIGRWPRYKSLEEMNRYMDELREDCDVDH